MHLKLSDHLEVHVGCSDQRNDPAGRFAWLFGQMGHQGGRHRRHRCFRPGTFCVLKEVEVISGRVE